MTKGILALVMGGVLTTAEMSGGLHAAREMLNFQKASNNVMRSQICGTPANPDDIDQVQGLMTAVDPTAPNLLRRAREGFSAADQAEIAKMMPSLCGTRS